MSPICSVLLAALLALTPMQLAHASTTNSDVIGLWSYATQFPVGSQTALTLRRSGNAWYATAASATARAIAKTDSIRFSFAHGDELRVHILQREPVRAFWLRRAVVVDPEYPQGASQAYASPLRLYPSGKNRWNAAIAPLPDPYTVYLSIFEGSDGTLHAAFRNPERNDHGPAMQLDVVRDADTLTFSSSLQGAGKPIRGAILPASGRIQIEWPDFSGKIAFTRATPGRARSFYAKDWPATPYQYRQPQDTGDGWHSARAASLGVNETSLGSAVQRIADMDPSGARVWPIHSISVAYKGRLILDEYFYGHTALDVHDMRSASKTFANVIIGGAMEHGISLPIDLKVYDVLSAMGPFSNPDPRKSKITLEHILTHTSGLDCDDNNDASPGNEDKMQGQTQQPNLWKYTLNLPIAHEPGTHYAYCSANINLVGAVLTARTHEWLPALFDRTVATPLQFGSYYWNIMPNGDGYLGGGAYVRPRDFLKLGQVYLDQGVWNGHQVVPAEWVLTSLAAHARISPETTGMHGNAFQQVYWETDEGLAWHMLPVKSGAHSYPAYFANGNGGQLLVIVPAFDLAVMFTAGGYGTGLWNRERDNIVGDLIIPALRSAAARTTRAAAQLR